MSSLDQDVAAILGLPSDRFAAAAARGAPRRSASRAPLLLGALLLLLAGGAVLMLSTHRPPQTSLAMEARLQAPDAVPTISPPTSGGMREVLPARAASSGPVSPAPPSERAPGAETARSAPPAPPPPPSRFVYEELRPAPSAAASGIVKVPQDKLTSPKAEKLASVQSAGANLEIGPRVNTPNWLSAPNGEEVARAYPAEALREGVPGSVELACLEISDGTVVNCRVMDETPEGAGFGRAALRLSRLFRFSPATADGRPVEAEVRIPYDFSVVD